MFREWIYIVSTIIIMFGFIVRIMQLLLKIKKKCKDYSNKHIYYVIFTINMLLNTNSGTIYIGIENKYGYEYKLERTTCYDEKVEIISINE